MFHVSSVSDKRVFARRTSGLGIMLLSLLMLLLSACSGAGSGDGGARLLAYIATAKATRTLAAAEAAVPTATPTPTAIPPTPTPEPAEPTPTPTEVLPEGIQQPSGFIFYANQDGRFELELPDNWLILDENSSGLIAGSPMKGGASIAVIVLPGDALLTQAALEEDGAGFLSDFFDDREVTVNETQLEADGSISFDFTAISDSGNTLEGLMFAEQRGLDLSYLVFVSQPDLWSDYSEAVFDPVIQSYLVTPNDTVEFLSPPLALSDYADANGLYQLAFPTGWDINAQGSFAAATVPERFAAIMSVSNQVNYDLDARGIEAVAPEFLSNFYGDDYEIESMEANDNGTYTVVFKLTVADTNLRALMLMLQGRQYLYALIFQTAEDDWPGLFDTFLDVVASYRITPPPPPAATSTPPPPPANPFAPQSGRSRLYVFNELGEELTFTINNQEIKIPPGGLDNPVPIDLDAGRYTYTVSIPFGSANGEVTMGPNQSWAVGVRGDGAVYNPFQVYP